MVDASTKRMVLNAKPSGITALDKPYLTEGEVYLKEYVKELAPILGWLAAKNNVLENFYVFSDNASPLGALLNFLFYRAKGVEFEPTKRVDNIVAYLSPYSIGVLIGAVGRSFIFDKEFPSSKVRHLLSNDPALEQLIERQKEKYRFLSHLVSVAIGIFDKKGKEIEYLNLRLQDLASEIETLVASLNRINSNIQLSAPLNLRQRIQALDRCARNLSKKKVYGEDSSEIKIAKLAYNKQIDALSNFIKMAKERVIGEALQFCPESVKSEYQILRETIAEKRREKAQIPQSVFEIRQDIYNTIRSAWSDHGYEEAFFEANMPLEKAYRYLDKYLETFLHTQDPSDVLTKSLPRLISLLEDCVASSQNEHDHSLIYNSLIVLLFSKAESREDVLQYFNGIIDITPEFISEHLSLELPRVEPSMSDFEATSVAFYRNSRLESPVPPIASTRYVMQSYKGETIRFPDCGETALRNIVNIYIYDAATQTFDVAILKQSNLSIPSKLLAFYEEFPRVSDTTSQQVHNSWAHLLVALSSEAAEDSKLLFIEPKASPMCEMRAGASNLKRGLKLLFGLDDLNEISEKLNAFRKDKIALDLTGFYPTDTDRSQRESRIIFSISKTTVEVLCNHRHYRIYERNEQLDNSSTIIDLLKLYSNIFGFNRAVHLLAVELKRMPITVFAHSDFITGLTPSELLHFMLATRTDWVNDTIDLAWFALKHPNLLNFKNERSVVAKLIQNVPSINGYEETRSELEKYIIENDFEELNDLIPSL